MTPTMKSRRRKQPKILTIWCNISIQLRYTKGTTQIVRACVDMCVCKGGVSTYFAVDKMVYGSHVMSFNSNTQIKIPRNLETI